MYCCVLSIVLVVGVCAQRTNELDGPQSELWSAIKHALLASDGPDYFETHMKGAELPPFCGTVTSASPAARPQIIRLALSDKSATEVELRVIRGARRSKDDAPAAFRQRLTAGDVLEFSGIAAEFSSPPFLLVFDVPVEALHLR